MENKTYEQDPVKKIIDIDSFTSYLRGYRDNIVATRPSGWEKHPDLYSHINPDNSKICVDLKVAAWHDVPQTIQQAISFQYPCASVNEEKSIDLKLDISNGRLFLRLNSPSLVWGFRRNESDGESLSYDKFGKVVVPDRGLVILLKTVKSIYKGNWIASSRIANSSELKFINKCMKKTETDKISEEKLMKEVAKMLEAPVEKEVVRTRLATLCEFQDIIKILERERATAEWRESLKFF